MPILSTKLHLPSPRRQLVARSRLGERLTEGLHRKLTLISAPAGFGKTTLASEWADGCGRPVAWLSLDQGDSDPSRFLAYLVAALQTVAPDVGQGVLDLIQSSPPPPAELLLTTLLNEMAATPGDFVLVLDDYHEVDAQPVDEAVTFLLEHMPPQMHLLITTREDPQLPLARLRARGQLTELRAADLRFSRAEAATFLSEVMGLELPADDVASLETRTEGWIAGLQLAALSLQGREDAGGFIRAFAGDHRYVVDYLVEEVLQRQPQRVRDFLLQTAILDRLSGPLCNAVTGQEDGSQLLETLERGNLFVVPLDDRREWYRYHQLFADVLQARLLEERPEQLPGLHRLASRWYEEHGSAPEAIRHALAAQHVERAADLVELAWAGMDRSRQAARWLGWAQSLPGELIRARPVLSVGLAWAHLDMGDLETAEERLRDAEQWLDPAVGPGNRPETARAAMVVVDEAEFQTLPATIATARAYRALALGDVLGAVTYAAQALDSLPEGDHLRRGIAGSLLGLATWTGEDLDAAYRSFAGAMADFERAGNLLFAITGTNVLADIRLAQGRLREAVGIYEQALQRAQEQGGTVLRGAPELHVGLSLLLREQGDLQSAARQLLKSEELGQRAGLPRWRYRWCLARARMKEAEGDLDGALALLDEAERHYIRGPVPEMRPIGALRAQLWVRQGRLSEALAWASTEGLSGAGAVSYLREYEYLTLARVLIASYQNGGGQSAIVEARELLERLLQAADEGGRMGSVIDILVLLALAYEAEGDSREALMSLGRALALAEPQGYVRTFVDEGGPMARLLVQARTSGLTPGYTGRLLAAFGPEEAGSVEKPSLVREAAVQLLIEPLSERELEVLQLVGQGLSNREIGERLFLALSTVKGHNRNIYGKLQVKNRTEAVLRARELGLL